MNANDTSSGFSQATASDESESVRLKFSIPQGMYSGSSPEVIERFASHRGYPGPRRRSVAGRPAGAGAGGRVTREREREREKERRRER